MMVRRCAPMIRLVLMVTGVIWGFPLLAQSSTQVELNQTLHFDDLDGKDVQVRPGTYEVSHSEGNQLQLSQANKELLTVQAQLGGHTESITQPEAILLPDEIDSTMVSVILLLPDGTGWEAMGSTTGVQSRGRINRSRRKINLSRILRSRARKRLPSSSAKPLPPAIPIPSDCPAWVTYNIWGYPSGVTDPRAAPNGPQIIEDLVSEVLKSYRPGCWPISAIIITGYSDKSPGGIQVDDYISVQRAVDAKKVLQQEFKTRAAEMTILPGYPSPADMFFRVGGIGSREQPDGPAQQPTSRRVDMFSRQVPVTIEEKTNRAGGDFDQLMLPTYDECRYFCSHTKRCRAYTYMKPVPPQTDGQCFLKKSIPRPSRHPNAISGVVLPAP